MEPLPANHIGMIVTCSRRFLFLMGLPLFLTFVFILTSDVNGKSLQSRSLTKVPPSAVSTVRIGSEVLEEDQFNVLRNKRVGLFTNPSAVNHNGKTALQVLRKARGIKLVALFAAEHGIQGDIPAGKEYPNGTHAETGLPLYSLYGPGPTRKPTPAMLKGIDALVYDIQDTGCRSYTFISSMGLAMEACGEAGVEFIVLDRPNPLGGLRVEGPILNPKFKSLVGQWEIPYTYGMTCGELATMILKEKWISKPCKLTVIRMKGWKRETTWQATKLPWVPPSPNIQQSDTALYYVSSGILGSIGGINIGFDVKNRFRLSARLGLTPLSWPKSSTAGICKEFSLFQ